MNIESKVKEWLTTKGWDPRKEVYDGIRASEIMAYCIKDLMPGIQADKQKKITLKGIEPIDITNGSKYIWKTPTNSILVSACLDGLISHHDDQFWPKIGRAHV